MNATVFNRVTGQILRSITAPVGMVSVQLTGPDEDWIEGCHPGDAFYIEEFNPVPFPARPSASHIFNYTTKQWEDPRTTDTQWPVVRAQRNRLLSASDWTQLPDVPLAAKEAWATYRQALRDVTEQLDPFSISWPTPPG